MEAVTEASCHYPLRLSWNHAYAIAGRAIDFILNLSTFAASVGTNDELTVFVPHQPIPTTFRARHFDNALACFVAGATGE